MDGMLVPILIAAVVILVIWGLSQFVMVLIRGDKRKLSQRLSTEARTQIDSLVANKSITRQMEATGLPPFLAECQFILKLHRYLVQAWPELTIFRFFSIVATCAAIPSLILTVAFDSPVMGAVAFLGGGYLPFFILSSKRNKRQQLLSKQLPEALDFLSRILKAGHSLTTGLQMMSEELPKPIATEFRRSYDQHSLGSPLEDALKDMVTRVESTDFAFFITAVLIQRQTGGDLSEVLNNISTMIRDRVRLANHVSAKTAEGRFTGYILVAFPALMFCVSYTLNKEYAGVLLEGTGLILLGVAFGLQMLGLVAIRKITTVRV